MTPLRYRTLQLAGDGLTQAELAEGWHFCPDWDYELIGQGMKMYDYCTCGREE